MHKLSVLCGYPGAGKTTLLFPSEGEGKSLLGSNAVIFSPDEFRLEMTGQAYYQPAEDHVWATVKSAVAVLLRRHDIIIDGTHVTVGSRSQWIRLAKRLDAQAICYWLMTPYEVCCERNSGRERPVPTQVMERMRSTFIPPSYEEGFDDIICIERSWPYFITEQMKKPEITVNIDLEQELG